MSIRLYIRICFFILLAVSVFAETAAAGQFEILKRGHFIIYHNDRTSANKLSWKAEYHYKRILNHFGVSNFRPWENKDECPIYIFSTRDEYIQSTGAPEWSQGIATYKPFMFASYRDAQNLLENTLPHEMTHMLLFLFMGKRSAPPWLNEGMAQFEEEEQSSIYHRKRFIKYMVKKGSYIRIQDLMSMSAIPPDKVDLFYAEAASVTDHLITDNIRANFGRFLTSIKRDEGAEDSLKKSYQWKYKNGFSDLEKKWLDFIKRKY